MMLYLARHGEVESRYRECYNGWLDVRLSDGGVKEAQALAGRLEMFSFDAVYSSDLSRCRATLAAFDPGSVTYDAALREKSWGEAEGLNYDEVCAKLGIVYENFSQWIEALGGESLEDFRARVESFFDGTILPKGGNNVLVMTHAGVIRTLLSRAAGLGLEEAFGERIPTGSYTRIEKNRDGWIVHEVGVK